MNDILTLVSEFIPLNNRTTHKNLSKVSMHMNDYYIRTRYESKIIAIDHSSSFGILSNIASFASDSTLLSIKSLSKTGLEVFEQENETRGLQYNPKNVTYIGTEGFTNIDCKLTGTLCLTNSAGKKTTAYLVTDTKKVNWLIIDGLKKNIKIVDQTKFVISCTNHFDTYIRHITKNKTETYIGEIRREYSRKGDKIVIYKKNYKDCNVEVNESNYENIILGITKDIIIIDSATKSILGKNLEQLYTYTKLQ